MTLLASERSLLIRNKFRSVLQLRIQNRRQNEIDSGLKTTCSSRKGEKDQSKTLRLTDDGATQKSPLCGLNIKTAQDRSVCGTGRQKKARLANNLGEKVQHRPGPLDLLHKHILHPENRPVSFPLSSDVFQDDISSCSSSLSPEQLGVLQSPAFSSSPGFSDDQSLSDLSPGVLPLTHSPAHVQSILALLPATEGISQPMSMTMGDSNSMATTERPKGMYLTSHATPLLPKTARSLTPPSDSSSLTPFLTSSRPPRPRKPRDSQPKMRKLKYHQYIPPDQRATAGTAGGGASQRSPTPAQLLDPAYSSLLQQQQVFLQLQILQNQQQNQQQQDQQQQQQLTVTSSGDTNQMVRFSGAMHQDPQPVSKATNHTSVDTSPSNKSELLPPNLVDLTVSELRQQLRKRGLPVSGTKPALLQRLRPFQLPHLCLTPVPLCQLGTSLEPLTPTSLLTPSHYPSSCPSSGTDSPTNSPNHQVYIQSTGVLSGVPNGIVNDIPNGNTNGNTNGIGVSVVEEQCGFLAPALTPSSTPSPGLPPRSSSPLSTGASWRSEQEQQELSLELEMRERMRSRPRERLSPPLSLSCGGSLHPFLQQDPRWPRETPEREGQTEILFTQVFCCQPWDVIGQDFELPMQITASPIQAPPSVRSLEEELQEAINRVLMDPSQSIEDILEEPTTCVDSHSSSVSVTILPGPSSPPQTDQAQPFRCHSKDDNFLSSPLCSSLLLELPPSPSTMVPRQAAPPHLPPSICTSPLPPAVTSRKRPAQATFDPADWLESLASGLRPLSPPSGPFVETDFGLNSDLNVNRALDLMVEQW
ncbi:myocardin-like [Salvelinus fontinalis]|uniref:myocardin-like n=2 Tax=Salvelinus fontinalis TaxID=8038 RepID=UPI002484FBAF|nr:myocardin-like [Salvelinus fontinalis]